VGAGIVWPGSGIVVTNAHVVDGRRGQWPIVELADGRSFEARLAARDAERDLALLALERTDQPIETATLGDSRTLRVGEIVVAVGHPLGVTGAMSFGVVHAVRDDGWVRGDIRLAPGNSGGPLATLDGAIIGLNSMVVRGLGVAIAVHRVQAFVADVFREPNASRPDHREP
jgi:serine protease Do